MSNILKSQGLQLAIASTFGATKNLTAFSNANPGIATLEASHGILVGDVLELTSGWKRATGRVARASVVATNDVTIEGINTSSTSDYPATEGVGTIREITGWTTVSQLLPDIQVSGGGFRFQDVTEVDDVRAKQIPILAEATTLTFKFHYYPTLAWLSTVEDAARAGLSVPYRMSIGAARLYGNAFFGYNGEPTIEGGVFVGTITLATTADSITYAS